MIKNLVLVCAVGMLTILFSSFTPQDESTKKIETYGSYYYALEYLYGSANLNEINVSLEDNNLIVNVSGYYDKRLRIDWIRSGNRYLTETKSAGERITIRVNVGDEVEIGFVQSSYPYYGQMARYKFIPVQ